MNESQLAGQAIQLETKAMDAVSNVLEAVLGALGDGCRDAEGRAIYGAFKQYVTSGGTMMGCPISTERVEAFERAAQAASLTYSVVYNRGEHETATVLFMGKDKASMDSVIDTMLEAGLPLIKDQQLTVEELINSLGEDGLDETIGADFVTAQGVENFRVLANQHELPFAIKQKAQGDGYVLLTASSDYKKLIGTIGMTCQTTHLNDLGTMQKVKEEVAKERELQGTGKGKGKEPERER